MKESIHYLQVQYHDDDPNFTPQQEAQYSQEIMPALDLIQDPRILEIYAQPRTRIHTIHYKESLGVEFEGQSIDKIFGCHPRTDPHSIRIKRTFKESDYNRTESDYILVFQLAPTQTLFLAGVLLHEMGHHLLYHMPEVWELESFQKIRQYSQDPQGRKVSPRCRYNCAPEGFSADHCEYFPETLVGTLLFPELQKTLDPDGYQAVNDFLDQIRPSRINHLP